jgi:hypothetical protein
MTTKDDEAIVCPGARLPWDETSGIRVMAVSGRLRDDPAPRMYAIRQAGEDRCCRRPLPAGRRAMTLPPVDEIEALLAKAAAPEMTVFESIPEEGFECFWIHQKAAHGSVQAATVDGPQTDARKALAWLFALAPALARAYVEQAARLAAAEKLAEAVATVISGDLVRPVAAKWRTDGVASKHDRCPHGRSECEDCEECADTYLAVALAEYRATKGDKG